MMQRNPASSPPKAPLSPNRTRARARARARTRSSPYLLVLLSYALLASACGDDTSPPDSNHAHEDAGTDAAQEGEGTAFEGCPDSTPTFALGMEAKGTLGHITGRLLAASNDPPLRYLNDWTVEFVDSAGEPLEDVTIRSARPFMPVHGHDGNVKPVVRASEAPGRFEITGFNLNMRGPWQIQFQLRSPRAGDDYVVFEICVQE